MPTTNKTNRQQFLLPISHAAAGSVQPNKLLAQKYSPLSTQSTEHKLVPVSVK